MRAVNLLTLRKIYVSLPGLPPGVDGLRIAHISDLHFRRWGRVYEEARLALIAQDYDLLLVTGDFSGLPQRWRFAASMIRRFFDGIDPRLGTFAVLGNHDRPRLGEQPGLPFRLLRNEVENLDIDGEKVQVAGLEQCEGVHGDAQPILPHIDKDAATILLAHYPSTAYELPPGAVQLQLSGHTHGGQIHLPRLGCIFTNDRIPTEKASGLHRIGATMVHTSPGIGVSGPLPFRFGCPAEITILTLRVQSSLSKGEPTSPNHRKISRHSELVTSV